MEITRESDYAIRCILYLSGKPGEVNMIDAIAREMQIPKSFLAKILQKLTRAGLVKSFRGVKGGFQLARLPGEISLLDVVEAIEGDASVNVCALDQTLCGRSKTCPVHPVWVEIRKDFRKILKKYNFARLKLSGKKGSNE
ncbi:MAG TPA: Rrf2 family transcriptional regulator [Dissulfurispiraceae bacterium]|nr:Rrf2 family transcriptional regulator [Dissulfurispiraceae bacterium]